MVPALDSRVHVSHQLSVRARSEPEAAGHAALFFHGLMHDSDLSNGRLAQRLTDGGVRASTDRPGTRVRGCFHVNTGSFSRKRISIRIPFVSWLYSKT